jgi:hypothetical protein
MCKGAKQKNSRPNKKERIHCKKKKKEARKREHKAKHQPLNCTSYFRERLRERIEKRRQDKKRSFLSFNK